MEDLVQGVDMLDKAALQVLDANFNRATEGVRVCEDFLRFYIKLPDVAKQLKSLRHDIVAAKKLLPADSLLQGRDVASDANKFVDVKGEKKRTDVSAVFNANLHRATEAVRSLEEYAKLFDVYKANNPFQKIRFKLYEIEKSVAVTITRSAKLAKMQNSLYAIVDSSFIKNDKDYITITREFIAGGADIIQLRMKHASKNKFLKIADEFVSLCKRSKVLAIINDNIDIALLTDADGVHLGQDDLPYTAARKVMGSDKIIGVSTHSVMQYKAALKDGCDYIALGPVFDTTSKHAELLPGIGLDVIAKVPKSDTVPVVAIGGIDMDSVVEVLQADYDSIACISILYKDGKYKKNCKDLKKIISNCL